MSVTGRQERTQNYKHSSTTLSRKASLQRRKEDRSDYRLECIERKAPRLTMPSQRALDTVTSRRQRPWKFRIGASFGLRWQIEPFWSNREPSQSGMDAYIHRDLVETITTNTSMITTNYILVHKPPYPNNTNFVTGSPCCLPLCRLRPQLGLDPSPDSDVVNYRDLGGNAMSAHPQPPQLSHHVRIISARAQRNRSLYFAAGCASLLRPRPRAQVVPHTHI